jgi:spoIIIJ-associated protein
VEWVETTGKSIDEAKEAALDRLGVDEPDAEFEIVEEAKAGLFGRVRREARVRARIRPTQPRAKDDRRDRRRRGRNGERGGGRSRGGKQGSGSPDSSGNQGSDNQGSGRRGGKPSATARATADQDSPKAEAGTADDKASVDGPSENGAARTREGGDAVPARARALVRDNGVRGTARPPAQPQAISMGIRNRESRT